MPRAIAMTPATRYHQVGVALYWGWGPRRWAASESQKRAREEAFAMAAMLCRFSRKSQTKREERVAKHRPNVFRA
jgi:hypothetical protein